MAMVIFSTIYKIGHMLHCKSILGFQNQIHSAWMFNWRGFDINEWNNYFELCCIERMEIRCSCVNFIFNPCAKVNIPLQINLDMKENVTTVFLKWRCTFSFFNVMTHNLVFHQAFLCGRNKHLLDGWQNIIAQVPSLSNGSNGESSLILVQITKCRNPRCIP